MKTLSVFQWHKWFKGGCKNVEDDERSGYSRSHRKNENDDKARNLVHSNRPTINQAYYVEILRQLHGAVCRKGLNFGPTIRFTTMLQLTRCSLLGSFWPKYQLLKWNTHPVTLIWL